MKKTLLMMLGLMATSAVFAGCSYDDDDLDSGDVCSQCKQDQFCSNNKCEDKKYAGVDCHGDRECKSGSCQNNTCTCGNNDHCTGSRVCDNDNKSCTTPKEGLLGGETCTNNSDCKSGSCQNDTCTCNDSVKCIKDMACIESTCTTPKGATESCTKDNECRSGKCNKDNTCACNSQSSCPNGLACSNDACVNKTAAGQSCETNDNCLSGVCSDNKICTCSDNAPCAEDKFCNSEMICTEKIALDGQCEKDSQCKVGVCDTQKCVYLPTGASCSSDSQCSTKCVNGICACPNGLELGDDNKCYGNAIPGKQCQTDSECINRLCVKNVCATCSQNEDCGDHRVCDNGSCRDIVPCPMNSTKNCFATTYLLPNRSWAGGTINENSVLSPVEYIGANYTVKFPESKIYLCIHPVHAESLFVKIEPLLKNKELLQSVLTAKSLEDSPIVPPSISTDELMTLMNGYPYIWAIAYERFSCQNNETCTIPEYSKDRFNTLLGSILSGFDSTEIDTDRYEDEKSFYIFKKMLETLLDPRIINRLQSGCLEIQMTNKPVENATGGCENYYTDDGFKLTLLPTENIDDNWKNHNIYAAFYVQSSEMMGNTERFVVSFAPEYEKSECTLIDTSDSKIKNVIAKPFSSQITFPVTKNDTILPARYELSKKPESSTGYSFIAKPSYLPNTATGKYHDVLCDEYYTMNFTKAQGLPAQYCSSEQMCNADAAKTGNDKTNCTPSIFTRVNSLKIFIEVDDDSAASN